MDWISCGFQHFDRGHPNRQTNNKRAFLVATRKGDLGGVHERTHIFAALQGRPRLPKKDPAIGGHHDQAFWAAEQVTCSKENQ